MSVPSVQDLRDALTDFVARRPARVGVRDIWREPLLVTARVDERFEALREMVVHDHAMPADLLATGKSVVVFFVPFKPELAQENTGGKFPARSWGEAYVTTNNLINDATAHLSGIMRESGFACAGTMATHNFDHKECISRWSHKHLAHLCGLGRFGVNCQLITPVGACGRLGSLVTEARLGDHPLALEAEYCLHKRGEECLACVEACPVKALSPDGFERFRCWERLQFNRDKRDTFADLPESTHVCAKCQVGMPCAHRVP